MKIDKIITDDDLIEFLLGQHEQTKNPVFLSAANSIWLYWYHHDVLNLGLSESNKWISVEERLPEESGHYLFAASNPHCGIQDGVGVSYFMHKVQDWKKINKNYVTHWMPLPKPPKN